MSIKTNEEEKSNYLLPNKSSNKKTLVLDLDETLVHSQFMPFNIKSDIKLKIELENEIHDIFILVRPGLQQFLEKMGKIFEIVIFTASISSYADPLLDIIDKNNLCKYRLYREHCTEINNCFIKEIKKLGRDLKDVIIVDNSPLSYYFNPENGIPISSWFDDKNDKELYNVSFILEFLSFVPDVRNFIKKFVVNNQISYNNVVNLLDKYNEILTKNQNKVINFPNNNIIVNNDKLLKKNNSKNKNKILIEQNKENINSNNTNINYNNNDIKNNIFSNYIKIKKNSQKNCIKEVNINNIKNNYKKISNKNKIFQKENKDNNNQNLYDMQTFSNIPMNEIFKKNQSTKNKYSKNINFNISQNIPDLSINNLNQNNFIKKGINKIYNYSNNQNININNEKIKHKKSDSVNLLRHHKKIIENKCSVNKTNSLLHSSNIILNPKKKILNNLNKYKLMNYQNSTLVKKNKNHKFSIQLSMRNNTDLNNELENLDESKNNNKLSKSLNKENFYKNHSCNKSTILKHSKSNYISKIYHKKNKSINNSLFGLSINFSKDESKVLFKNSSKNQLKFKHKRFLSTSESYNNTLLKNRIIINNTNQATTLINATITHKPHFSQRKIKNLKELQILKTERNNNILMYKEKKRMNKIPFKINNKRYSANENTLKIKIPINKNILYNIDKNYKNKIIQNICNNNDNSLSSISLTARHKSLKQIAYERIITENNEIYKEGKSSLYDLNNKKSFKERVNNNILKNNTNNSKKKFIITNN